VIRSAIAIGVICACYGELCGLLIPHFLPTVESSALSFGLGVVMGVRFVPRIWRQLRREHR
jgi:hypothetical protein